MCRGSLPHSTHTPVGCAYESLHFFTVYNRPGSSNTIWNHLKFWICAWLSMPVAMERIEKSRQVKANTQSIEYEPSSSPQSRGCYLGSWLIGGLPRGGQGGDGEAVWVLPVADLRLLQQVVQLLLSHVLHLLPGHGRLEGERGGKEWRSKNKQWRKKGLLLILKTEQ